MTKIAHVQPYGNDSMTVYYDEKAKVNPYVVKATYYTRNFHLDIIHNGMNNHYEYHKHTKITNRYADLASAMYELYQYAFSHNEEGRALAN